MGFFESLAKYTGDTLLRESVRLAEGLQKAVDHSMPLILFVDHSRGFSILLPKEVSGNILTFKFHDAEYMTVFKPEKALHIKNIPAILVLENVFEPLNIQHIKFLTYADELASYLYPRVKKLYDDTIQQLKNQNQNPASLQEFLAQLKTDEERAYYLTHPHLLPDRLLQLEAILQLLKSHEKWLRAQGALYALPLFEVDPARVLEALDPTLLEQYRIDKVSLREIRLAMKLEAIKDQLTAAGLLKASGGANWGNILKWLLLGLIVFIILIGIGGALTTFFGHPGALAPPAGVKVP
jgi:hypothetical protein